jgi:hypothetical protein
VVLGKDDVAILKIKLLSVCLLVLTRLSDGNVYEAIANTFIERFSVLANDRLADWMLPVPWEAGLAVVLSGEICSECAVEYWLSIKRLSDSIDGADAEDSLGSEAGLAVVLGGEACFGYVVENWLSIKRLSDRIDRTDAEDSLRNEGSRKLLGAIDWDTGERSSGAFTDADWLVFIALSGDVSTRLLEADGTLLLILCVISWGVPSTVRRDGDRLAGVVSFITLDLGDGGIETTGEMTVDTETETRALDLGVGERVMVDFEVAGFSRGLFVAESISSEEAWFSTISPVGEKEGVRPERAFTDECIGDSNAASVCLEPGGCTIFDARVSDRELWGDTLVVPFDIIAEVSGSTLLASSWRLSQPSEKNSWATGYASLTM